MNKKKVIMIIVAIILIIVFIIINVRKNKKILTEKNAFNSDDLDIEYSFDETNEIYVIYDKNTNEVLQTTKDIDLLEMYESDPEFNPSFQGVEDGEIN